MKFSVLVVIFCVIGFLNPASFVWAKEYIIPLLIIIMTSMALTLTYADFKRVLKSPKPILLGVGLQFMIMPLLALVIGIVFQLSEEYVLGMVLVGSVAGGTASNVMCFLAGGRVALSITMTAISTLCSIVLTPLLLELYMGSTIDIPVSNMFMNLLKIIFFPVLAGTFVRTILRNNKRFVIIINKYSYYISQTAIIATITIVVALNAEKFSTVPLLLYISVILHNIIGMVVGYYVSIVFIKDRFVARTVAIEVGMQNSGLAVGLAIKYFNALVGIPAVVFSVIHNISGSLYAGFVKATDNKMRYISRKSGTQKV